MISRRLGVSLVVAALAAGSTTGARADEPPLPRAGCAPNATDPADDSGYPLDSDTPVVAQDAQVDITGIYVGSKGRTLLVYLSVPGLTGNSTSGEGPKFEVEFTVKGGPDTVKMQHGKPKDGSAWKTLNPATTFPLLYMSTKAVTDPSFTGTLDLTNKLVKFTVSLDFLATQVGTGDDPTPVPTPAGTEITINAGYAIAKVLTGSALHEKTKPSGGGIHPSTVSVDGGDLPMDTAPAAAITYKVGDASCFAPPPSKLAGLAGTTVQFGDSANLSAKLTNAAGDVNVAGKTVTFSIAGKSVSGTTGPDGVARASLAHGKTKGAYPLTVTFAGDDSYDATTLPGTLTVKEETVKFKPHKIVKSGTTRNVTVTLIDDDNKPVAGQTVNWYVNGKKATSKKTAPNGTATYSAKAGQTVYAESPAVPGKYLRAKSSSAKLA